MKANNMTELMSVSIELQTVLESGKNGELLVPLDVYGRLTTVLEKVDRIISSESLEFE